MKINYYHKYISEQFYHVYNHASGERNIFRSHSDYQDFLEKYNKYFKYLFGNLGYCLMPNHFHFLLVVKKEDEIKECLKRDVDSNAKEKYLSGDIELSELISDQFRRLFSAYSLKYNIKYKTRGQLFLNRHKRILINPETRLNYMLCYIHHNPTHHKFRSEYGNWPYCSYQKYIYNDQDYAEYLDMFGGLEKFQEMHRQFQINMKDDSYNIDALKINEDS
jgi:putative transposase